MYGCLKEFNAELCVKYSSISLVCFLENQASNGYLNQVHLEVEQQQKKKPTMPWFPFSDRSVSTEAIRKTPILAAFRIIYQKERFVCEPPKHLPQQISPVAL